MRGSSQKAVMFRSAPLVTAASMNLWPTMPLPITTTRILSVMPQPSSVTVTVSETADQALAVVVVVRVLQQRLAGAGPGNVDLHHLAHPRLGAIGHHHHPVGEQNRLVDIVGNHQRRELGAIPDLH